MMMSAALTQPANAKALISERLPMTDLFDNPMGLMGFEFVEFASRVPVRSRYFCIAWTSAFHLRRQYWQQETGNWTFSVVPEGQ